MKSLGVAALVVIASWCSSCEPVSAQAPGTAPGAAGGSSPGPATAPATGTETAAPAAPEVPPVPKPPADVSNEQAVVNEAAAANAHLATPGGELTTTSFPALRQFLEDSQNAHDKMIVDRFLIGVAILFAVIAAALYFSLPPKPREQKE